MSSAKVLVVDDSAMMRSLITKVLSSVPEIDVVGTAEDGREGLQRVEELVPDIITLDIEMPEMNGIEMLHVLRKDHPRLPVIMFSSYTDHGAQHTLDALQAGATDYVLKPGEGVAHHEAENYIRESLGGKIKVLTSLFHERQQPQEVVPIEYQHIHTLEQEFAAVAIGVSTGGPEALDHLLSQIPRNFSLPILIVQHMPPNFTKLLADRLNQKSGLSVSEAKDGDVVKGGHVYIAPGDFHLFVEQSGQDVVLRLNQAAAINSCRPSVDVLFASVARVYGKSSLAVMLTGMGEDGLRGTEKIVESGGRLIAQDQESSVVWGMAGAVVRAGLADMVCPLEQILTELISIDYQGGAARS